MPRTLSLVKDVRGCMARFDPLTPEIVAVQSEGDLTYDELKEALSDCGMDIEKVVFDASRSYLRTPYARRLPLVAGGLLEEPLLECIKSYRDGKLEVPNGL